MKEEKIRYDAALWAGVGKTQLSQQTTHVGRMAGSANSRRL